MKKRILGKTRMEVSEVAFGGVEIGIPYGIGVQSAADMAKAVLNRVRDADVFVAIAAVADYTPIEVAERKIKKSADPMTIRLVP